MDDNGRDHFAVHEVMVDSVLHHRSMVVTYKVVCGMFFSGDDFVPIKRQSPNLGDMTKEELRAYNGFDSEKPFLMAIKGKIYDVSTSKMFYGTGGSYAMFVRRDYTGLWPTTFFTTVALMVVTYKVVCGMFFSADDFVPIKR
ncbi:putative steroid-binding protein 3 [Capsicum annuum]|nr:putative steroid-binding protein 3 [Capsicum annuum]